MAARKHDRIGFFRKANWDFFTAGAGKKEGFITNISPGGCMLKTSDAIDHRRWIRIVIKDEAANLWFTLVGRAVRCENALEAFSENDVTLYRYGIEFTFPGPMSVHDFKLIETLASKSFTLRPGRDAPQIPSFRPGFLA